MLAKFSVKKPYTVLVGVILAIVLGVVSIMNMTTDLLPDMSFPYALIITTDVGASPEEIEKGVTAPIEASMATTSNIKSINSISYNSYSMVICEYEQNANMDSIVIEIQQSLDQLSSTWDETVSSPIIMQIDPDMLPVMTAAVGVEGMDSIEVSEYVENEIVPALESIEGVASANATGTVEEKIVVTLNNEKIKNLNEKIQSAINDQFAEPEDEIESGLNQLEDGKEAIQSGATELESGLSSGLQEVWNQQSKLAETKAELTAQMDELSSQKSLLETVKMLIDEMLEKAPEEVKELPTIKEVLEKVDRQFLESLGIKVEELKSVEELSAELGMMLGQMDMGIGTIEGALTQIAEGEKALETALASINVSGVSAGIQMSRTYTDLALAMSSLEQAKQTLESTKAQAQEAADLDSILSLETITGLLTAQNFDMPAGYAYDGDVQYLVRVGEGVETVEDLANLVLMDMGMEDIDTIHLSDIADVELVDNSEDVYSIVNGNPSISLSLEKQTGYATGEVTDRILEKFEMLQKADERLEFTVLMDQGIYIDVIVDSVVQNMVVGAVLAILVLWVFLKDFKPTIVIACSIPLSVIVAIVLMYFTGISLNIISMSGLVLGIGMLVDNSIVVIENIYRFREEGYSIRKACVEGASEVSGAIVASTLTTVSVYAPIIFTDGITKQLFVDIALTVAFTLMASLLIALTFVPALASYTLKNKKEIAHPFFDVIVGWYENVLRACLKHKILVFVVSIALLIVTGAACLSRGMTFMDMNIETNQLSVSITAKEDEKLEFEELVEISNEAMERIFEIEGVDTIGASIGGNSTMSLMSGGSGEAVSMYVLLDENSDASIYTVADEIVKKTSDMDCVVSCETSSMDMTTMFGSGLSIQVKGSDMDKLQTLAAEVAQIVTDVEGTVEVQDGLDNQAPQFSIIVDKAKAAEYGYTVAQVFQLVYAEMASNTSAATISTDVKEYAVYLQTEEQSQVTLDDIKAITFTHTNKEGEESEIPLTDICTMEETATLSTISRSGQTRYLTVSCGIDENHNVTLVSNEVKEKINQMEIPEGYEISMTGEDETINESMSQMLLMLLLAVIFIYLIMVAQFQSLFSPFIIMFSIPLAFTGGFIALFLTGKELGIISMLGFIMLAGLIVNNGIVLIDYINQRRQQGASKQDAIIESGITRLRPILMTTMTTILAMSTSAAGLGDGSEIMQPMAITMIGGLLYGTILTLVVIPCIYDAFHKEKSMVEEEL
uniref:efflux RND transporter permease subunit n=1 Tax=Agathobacter sp. TaxID=2021311 RepID=UPI004055BF74